MPGNRPGECQQGIITSRSLKAKEADRRKDFVEKVSTALVKNYDVICLEDLKVKNMVASGARTVDHPAGAVAAKRALNRSICAQGWSMLRRRIADKAATCSVAVVAVNGPVEARTPEAVSA